MTSATNSLRIIGIILAFAGGIIALFASLGYFFEGEFMSHFDYNKVGTEVGETITIVGIFIFLIAIVTLLLTLFACKPHYSKKIFISLIVLGAFLLALLPFVGMIYTVFASFIASLLILAGGVAGEIAISLDYDKRKH